MTGIAIIGMACRLPGADTPGAFWQNLCAGVDSVSTLSDEDLRAAGIPQTLLAHPNYVKAAAMVAGADTFDAAFFGFSPREAAVLDPQQRLLLEVAWEAFEDAGYHPESYDGVAGVFAGGGGVVTSYLFAHAGHPALDAATASMPHLGNDKDFLATRVSYKLNLTGPSITVQTACSTSLVAVHLACQSLRAGECDVALVGATTVRVPLVAGYLAEKGNVYSLDGRCRAFDAAGQGTIFGSGVAGVLLKPVETALQDGDQIYAVVRGSAVNNDGGRKVSYPSPSVTGQARAMVEAFTLADCSPDTVRYVECHATGTTVGDPPEMHALTRAFRQWSARTGFCAVGSVKTNIGHPEQAAGLAGLIKTALALRHGLIPSTLHLKTPNPKIDFAASPFFVNTELQAWPADLHPRRAAVNSLGIGGTNAFVVMEEAPVPAAVETAGNDREGPWVVTLSAKTETALRAYITRLATFAADPLESLAEDVAYTSNVSRSQLPWRFAVIAGSMDDLRTKLDFHASAASPPALVNVRGAQPKVALLFSGQAAQYPRMATELYQRHPGFRQALDRCASALRDHMDVPLLELLASDAAAAGRLDETCYTQPAIVAVELALAEMWRAWGLQPVAVLGHSVGEIAAACVAGVFGVEDALRLATERGRLMQVLPKNGEMVAVLAPEAIVHDVLRAVRGRVAVAAVNGPSATVVSGERGAVRDAVGRLAAMQIASRPLRVSHAFHSPLMDPILDDLERAAQRIVPHASEISLISNVTGKVVEGPPDAAYWRAHARQPVRFLDSLRTMHELGVTTFMEIGPGSMLTGLGKTVPDSGRAAWLATLPRAGGEWAATIDALARLYMDGVEIDWRAVHDGARRRRVSMPTYPFQRQRYWLEPSPPQEAPDGTARAPAPEASAALGPHPLLGPAVRDRGSSSFESEWSLERLPYLRDHRVRDEVVLPTALAVEAALAGGRLHFDRPAVVIEGLVYHEILRFGEGVGHRVRVAVMAVADDRANFSVASRGSDGTWRTHVTGVIASSATDNEATHRLPASTGRRITQEEFYERLRTLGLDYGPSFRGIEEVRQGRGHAAGRVRLPPGLVAEGYEIHPAFLDACLHIFPAVLGGAAKPAGATYLPVGVERVRVYRTGVVAGTVHAMKRSGPTPDSEVVVDLWVTDDAARPAFSFEGLRLRALPDTRVADANRSDEPGLYQVRWESRPRPTQNSEGRHAPGAWLVFAQDGPGESLLAALREHGQHGHVVRPGQTFSRRGSSWSIDPRCPEHFQRLVGAVAGTDGLPLRGAVFMWPDGVPDTPTTAGLLDRQQVLGVGAALCLTQALLEGRAAHPDIGRLWLVTRNEQAPTPATAPTVTAYAMLWGFGRTVALEAPAIWGGLIDLPAATEVDAEAASALALELLDPDGETQIALRGGIRYVARLDRLARVPPPPRPTPRVQADATYLVTGGLGMLGLRTARLLVEGHGARSLVLVGRRRPSSAAQRTLAGLRARGARVRVLAADVTREADVRRMLRAVRTLPPLRGIFHGAGTLDDAVLARMTPGHLTRVAAPKVRGAWLLHQHTRALPLDFFVLHSSLLSLTGSPGQANYTAANAYLDALADHRRALGLPATALNWGPWGEGGMARSTGTRGETMWKARGVRYLHPDGAVRALDHALRSGLTHVAVAEVDWAQFLRQAPAAGRFCEAMNGATAEAAPGSDVDDAAGRLRATTGADRRALVLDVVRRHVMTELGFKEAIDTQQPLTELGLDSLMSVNVANRLEAALGIPVPVVKLIRGPSIEQLVDALIGDLGGATGGVPIAAETAANGNGSRTAGDGWLVVPRPRPAAMVRLVCFPFAGAGAGPFRRWADTLHPSIELVAVEPPGRASRIQEPPELDLERFFARLADALAPILDRPVAFFGHCLGGLVSWETVRRLRQRGPLDLRAFFVAGVRPPHRLTREGPFEHGLMERMLRHEDFDPLRPVHEQPDEVFAEVTRHFQIPATDEFLARPELRSLLLPTVRADFALTASYRHTPEPPWDVPITCFAGLDDPYVSREDAGAWAECTRRSFRLHWRPGAHFLVVDDRDFIVSAINHELAG